MVRRSARKLKSCVLATCLIILGCESLQNAVAEGDTRSIAFHHLHTGEDLSITYKRDGRYDPAALKKIDWVLRDWRRGEATKMDPHLIDLIWEVAREVGAKESIRIICGYRAPTTNAMLRKRGGRSSGVAQVSQHMYGNAIDFYIPGVPLEKLRIAGLRLQRGGVGFYPTSGSPFVHMDVGGVRHWPRMTHDQLARVFPDGRTVHIPSDGRPLAQYAQAKADIERRGSQSSALALARADDAASGPKRNILASLFEPKLPQAPEQEMAAASARNAPAPTALAQLPRPRPTPVVTASALPPPPATAVRAPVPSTRVASASVGTLATTANDVIRARGFWQGTADADIPTAFPRQTAPRNDRAPAELALAYAASAEADAARRLPLSGPLPPATSVAPKRPMAARGPADSPWTRAMMLAPDVRTFLRVALFGAPDYRQLAPLMAKPAASVMMTFSDDPYLGMAADRFGGEAVVFLATVTFSMQRTAALAH